MLILSRKVNESLHIGDKIVVKVIAIQEGQVKIGIDAPVDVKIFRSEIYEAIQESNRSAIAVTKNSVVEAARRLPRAGAASQPKIAAKIKKNLHRE